MSTLEEIEDAILRLPAADFIALRSWLRERDAEAWDRQLESDVNNGRLDALGDEAAEEFHAGRCREL